MGLHLLYFLIGEYIVGVVKHWIRAQLALKVVWDQYIAYMYAASFFYEGGHDKVGYIPSSDQCIPMVPPVYNTRTTLFCSTVLCEADFCRFHMYSVILTVEKNGNVFYIVIRCLQKSHVF